VAAGLDAIIVADYGKGLLTSRWRITLPDGARAQQNPDRRPSPSHSLSWQGATAIKPNRAEAFMVVGLPASDPWCRCFLTPAARGWEPLLQLWKPGAS